VRRPVHRLPAAPPQGDGASQRGRVAHDLAALLGPDGVARTAGLAERVDRHTVSAWVRQRRLLRPYPGVVVLPERWDRWATRAIAAVLATDGVLSHTSALTVWRVLPEEGSIHVSVPAGRRTLRGPGLTVHRVGRLAVDRLGPFPVTCLPRAVTDTWGLGHGRTATRGSRERARGVVIGTVRERRVTTRELRTELSQRPALPGRRALVELLALVEQGCQSELEVWGVRNVLRGPGMPPFVQQHPVRLPWVTVHLDAAVPELKVAVELDGAAFHGSAAARERDTRRDVALAARGWVVLRFSYRRLTTDPEGCRREILEVCRGRRALLDVR
jgi:very-short-patch-repair endonuclease